MATSKCGAHLPSLLVKQILFDFFSVSCKKKKKKGTQNQSKLEYKNVADIFLKWFPFIGDGSLVNELDYGLRGSGLNLARSLGCVLIANSPL